MPRSGLSHETHRRPACVGPIDAPGDLAAERAAVERLGTGVGTGAVPAGVPAGVVLGGSVKWLRPEGPPSPAAGAGVLWRSALALERATAGELSLLGALLAGTASLLSPDRSRWPAYFTAFDGACSPVADALRLPHARLPRRRGMPRAGDLLYELSVGLRDQVRLIDAGRDEPLAIEMSTSLRDTRERVLVHVAERRYEVVRHGPVGQVDLRFSSHGLALLARREAQLPELVATGELEVAGDIRTVSAAATHLTPRF